MSKSMKFTIGIIAAILIAAGGSWVALGGLGFDSAESVQVVVTDGDGVEHVYSLDDDGEYTIETDLGTNTFAILDGEVVMIDADCPNHDCMSQAALSENSVGSIVCLPHELVIQIVGSSEALELDGVAS